MIEDNELFIRLSKKLLPWIRQAGDKSDEGNYLAAVDSPALEVS